MAISPLLKRCLIAAALVATAHVQAAEVKRTAAGPQVNALKPVSSSLVVPVAPTSGADLVIDVSGIESMESMLSPLNARMSFDVTPGVLIDQVAWNITLTAYGTSYLSEMGITLRNTSGAGVTLYPANTDLMSGTASYIGSTSLTLQGLAFNAGADGRLHVEFNEAFNDFVGAVDGLWVAGTFSVLGVNAAPVPEPASFALMGLGLFGVSLVARRRRH